MPMDLGPEKRRRPSGGAGIYEGVSEIAIVGGTGQYAGITGQMKSVNNGDGTFKQTLHYWIR